MMGRTGAVGEDCVAVLCVCLSFFHLLRKFVIVVVAAAAAATREDRIRACNIRQPQNRSCLC